MEIIEVTSEVPGFRELLEYPLIKSLFGRRSRRFGLGMEIAEGPLAHRSKSDPLPLSKQEQSLLIAAGTGVTGWSFGIPYDPANPDTHADISVRYTGRTGPTAAGIGAPILFYTDENGTYLTNTRDVNPAQLSDLNDMEELTDRIISICKENTTRLSDTRLDIPSKPGHVLDPNLWWANKPGSTLFMPVNDTSEEMLGLMCIFVKNGYLIVDTETGSPAGDLSPFIKSGHLDKEKVFPLSFLENATYASSCAELSFMAHNIVLMMQAMGLGGLYFGGINASSVMGSPAMKDVKGLGFTFVENEKWIVPNPVGLDGLYEGRCPPYYNDMKSAVEAFLERKFGPEGAYHSEDSGPWSKASEIKSNIEPYSDETVDCISEIAEYVLKKYGKFPGTIPTMVLPGCVQAHHIDTGYYDNNYKPGSYMISHKEHMKNWHQE